MSLGSGGQIPMPVPALEEDKYPYELGSRSKRITTSSPAAQRWFDRGLTWLYGFCHMEASRCFERALDLDPHCAMVLYGLALASGPHYNFGWSAISPPAQQVIAQKTHGYATRAKAACEASKRSSTPTTAVEDKLVDAVVARFPQDKAAENVDDYATWDAAYADAMKQAYLAAPNDMDVTALYAESLLNLAPWRMWCVQTGEPMGAPARTLEAKDTLEKALATPDGMKHPGILHMYIHLMEMSHDVEAAVPASDALRGLVRDAGHLQHMASHIDVLVGTYRKGMDSNIAAVEADRKYLGNVDAGMYTVYALHNIQSLIFAAMMTGNLKRSLEGCTRLEELATEEFLSVPDPPWADFAEAMLGSRYQTLVRFGRWNDILDVPLPKNQNIFCVTTAAGHYTRALAHAALGNIAAAEDEKKLFIAAADRVPESRLYFPNKSHDVLAVERAMLDGELEYRKGNFAAAFTSLEDAIRRDDELLYAEPPSFMIPPRHATAALLLEQGRVQEAIDHYMQDLGLDFAGKGASKAALPRARQHPLNPWALSGLHSCLVKLGRTEEAEDIKKKLDRATEGADVDINTSCFCAGANRRNGAVPLNGKLAPCCDY